jgi:hypothetical protein
MYLLADAAVATYVVTAFAEVGAFLKKYSLPFAAFMFGVFPNTV